MNKGLIIYQSKYGATKKYVNWIADAAGFDCTEAKKTDIKKAAQYETVIFAGGIYASGISGLSFLKKNIEFLKEKKLAVFCVGASPYDEKALAEIYGHNFKGRLNGIPCFYGRGIWNEEQMSFTDRTLCRILQKAVAKQEPSSYQPWQKALICSVGQKCDWTDKKYLKPLLDWVNL